MSEESCRALSDAMRAKDEKIVAKMMQENQLHKYTIVYGAVIDDDVIPGTRLKWMGKNNPRHTSWGGKGVESADWFYDYFYNDYYGDTLEEMAADLGASDCLAAASLAAARVLGWWREHVCECVCNSIVTRALMYDHYYSKKNKRLSGR